jgi:hypothetical protein
MSPADTARAIRLRLAGEMADDRASLDRLADAIASLVPPAADERGEWMRGLALAFEVERYYTAIETLLTRVLRTIDGDVPSGAGWHQEVLRGAAVALEGVRPAIVPHEIVADMRELLKFRHLARHGYEADPVLPRMVEHAERVGRAHPMLVAALDAFAAWLRAQ